MIRAGDLALSGLHPSVQLLDLGAGDVAFHDMRTDFRMVVSAHQLVGGDADPLLHQLLDALGLKDGDLPEGDLRQRQHRYIDDQSWGDRLERLRELLRFATARVPYYRDRQIAYDPGRIQVREDLSSLPRMRKADLRRAFVDLCSDDETVRVGLANGRLEMVTTSGTTEERVQALTDSTLVRIPSNYPAIFGIEPEDSTPRTAVLTSSTCLAHSCTLTPNDFPSRIVHGHTLYLPAIADPFSIDRRTVQSISDELIRFRPTFLFVNPVYAHLFAKRARELHIEVPAVKLVLSCYQYLSRIQRRTLGEAFRAPVRSIYAATELGGCQVALECGRGRLHLREDHCLVELLDGEDEPPTGRPGSVVVTTLSSRTMPLVRYALGDLAARTGQACDCPLSDWPSIHFHGRVRDALFVSGRWTTTKDVDDVVAEEPWVDLYCCSQLEDGRVQVNVVASGEHEVRTARLQDRLASALRTSKVTVVTTRRLEPAPSLKYPLTTRAAQAPS